MDEAINFKMQLAALEKSRAEALKALENEKDKHSANTSALKQEIITLKTSISSIQGLPFPLLMHTPTLACTAVIDFFLPEQLSAKDNEIETLNSSHKAKAEKERSVLAAQLLSVQSTCNDKIQELTLASQVMTGALDALHAELKVLHESKSALEISSSKTSQQLFKSNLSVCEMKAQVAELLDAQATLSEQLAEKEEVRTSVSCID